MNLKHFQCLYSIALTFYCVLFMLTDPYVNALGITYCICSDEQLSNGCSQTPPGGAVDSVAPETDSMLTHSVCVCVCVLS